MTFAYFLRNINKILFYCELTFLSLLRSLRLEKKDIRARFSKPQSALPIRLTYVSNRALLSLTLGIFNFRPKDVSSTRLCPSRAIG